MDAISANCHMDFAPAYHQSGTRPLSAIKWIVLHDTEGGGSARDVANYFKSPASGGSAHLVVDDNACYRCLGNTVIPWGAPGANTNGFHIEQLGYAAWTAKQWEQHLPMLHRAAYKIAFHAKLFGIPIRFLDAALVAAGEKGVTTHAQVTKAFPALHGTHTDPGTGYPMDLVLKLALHYKG